MRRIAIEVKHISKKVDNLYLFKEFSSRFEEGQIYGVIGQKKSGKSLFLKCIIGLVPISEGEIYRDDMKIGIALEEAGFIESWSAYKNIKYLAEINKVRSRNEIKQLLNWIGIAYEDKKPLSEYPLDVKRKLVLVQTLIEKPSIIVLDNFFKGLHEQSIKEMHLLLNQLCNQGITILISDTHEENLISLCDKLMKIEKGQVDTYEMPYRNLYQYSG